MAHYAKIEKGVVTQVIVADADFIKDMDGTWVQTSYNTVGGQHVLGGTPLRKNYAGVGYTYDEGKDAFIPPSPFESWVLNETTCLWEAPVSPPDDYDNGNYRWNEEDQTWDAVDG